MSREAMSAPGPFRAPQIRDGDPYELRNGHPVQCMTAGGRHGVSHMVGGVVLALDPSAIGQVGVDIGIAFNDDKNLRAPDIVVGAQAVPGWQRTFPPLAVEYADTGQDEAELAAKIDELLTGGTQLVWVVRLVGPLRVEVHKRGAPPRLVGADEELVAPGILTNPVPVRALVDPRAAATAAIHNLLQPHGFRSIEGLRAATLAEGRSEGRSEGRTEGQAEALLTVLAARGLVPTDAQLAEIRNCTAQERLHQWIASAVTARDVSEVLRAGQE